MSHDPAARWLAALPAEGEAVTLLRTHDWAATPIGPIAGWPELLRTTVSLCLASRFPMMVAWGPELVQVYNDAYRTIFGPKHPASFGARIADTWPEIWHEVGPMLEGVQRTGEAVWAEDQLLFVDRLGFPEDITFTFSYSPILDGGGRPAGVLVPAVETTSSVVGGRRLRALGRLGAVGGGHRTTAAAAAALGVALGEHPEDLPFAALYRADGDGGAALLTCAGVAPGGPLAPERLGAGEQGPWPWPPPQDARTADVLPAGAPAGMDGSPVRAARVLPLTVGGAAPDALLVLGMSPTRRVDEGHLGFLDLAAEHVATALRGAAGAEAAARRAAELEEADRAKTEFLATMSHELRTPLTLMLGPLTDVLAGPEPLSGGQRDALGLARRNAERLLRLVAGLLEFARSEERHLTATPAPVDLGRLTADVASMFRAACESAGLELHVDVPPAPLVAHADGRLWEHVVLNLLSNAVKHTFAGAISVSVREEGGRAVLAVRDTGTGIPDDELPRVFERFHRIRGARSRSDEGAGIGLALVRRIAEAHGGTAEVASQVGRGTTVTVRLPLGAVGAAEGDGAHEPRAARAAADEAASWTLPVDAGPDPDDPRPLVVVADDNADLRGYIAALLGEEHQVVLAADGDRALALARTCRPALVLADVMMPGTDGLALVRALRADAATATLPVILLSARAGQEAAADGLAAGADDYLAKPFTAIELRARVRTTLELAAARSALARAPVA